MTRTATAMRGYGIALVCVLAAFGFSMIVQRFFPYPFLFLFFAAVMASAWFGGTGAGLFSVLLSTGLVDYYFVPPLHSLAINSTDSSYLLAFIVCSLVASSVSSSKKRDEEALKEARDRLEIRVAERTVELEKSNVDLREREHQLRLLTEVIPQQIWSGNPDGSIDYCNQQLLDYTGCEMEEITTERFLETLHPQDRARFRQAWQRALATATPLEGEWRVRRADGGYRTFVTRAVPLFQTGDRPVRWYGTNTDIEDHKNAEQALLKTQAELAHLSRALTMGELTASIAHELNQPLTAVVAYGHTCAEWLSATPPNIEEARVAAGKIIQDGIRAGTVIRQIRALFQKETPARHPLDVSEVARELVDLLHIETSRQQVSIETEFALDLPKITGDRVQIQQVILNLLMNGMEAMRNTPPASRKLTVRTCKNELSEVVVQVEDSGAGLSPEIAQKIFNPFFTTKPQGLGMGLSISRSIVESHGGRLSVAPGMSGGAIFQFTIPVRSSGKND